MTRNGGKSDAPAQRTSVDPWSTFLRGAATGALIGATGAGVTAGAPVAAGVVVGFALAAALQHILQERRKENYRRINNDSVAVLLYIADGEPHTADTVKEALNIPPGEISPAINSLAENDLIQLVPESPESFALTREGRTAIAELSSQLAS